ncbi:hypothetical protein ASPBRDRAFT_496610 [Aspergillus brasiliensis CBS 101740]|uniref:Uncharacterized protein n=1 Tax=Aspergillus brasiliensis (strain CBS 101740 / IMI 381727 / IBT 21946) TaxID=767769 RepID=A0A1L9UNU7_ASPBC|nr:hypothetical protein ASPBRDRAFT_496610 [Aspergillus brasiliensis CBS 101740]
MHVLTSQLASRPCTDSSKPYEDPILRFLFLFPFLCPFSILFFFCTFIIQCSFASFHQLHVA